MNDLAKPAEEATQEQKWALHRHGNIAHSHTTNYRGHTHEQTEGDESK